MPKLQSDEELLSAIDDLLSGRIYVPRWLADDDIAGQKLLRRSTSI